MFFQYLGESPLDICPPNQHLGHQQKFTISVSPNGQSTNNEVLYNWLFDEAFEHTALFRKMDGYHHLPEQEPAKVGSAIGGGLQSALGSVVSGTPGVAGAKPANTEKGGE